MEGNALTRESFSPYKQALMNTNSQNVNVKVNVTWDSIVQWVLSFSEISTLDFLELRYRVSDEKLFFVCLFNLSCSVYCIVFMVLLVFPSPGGMAAQHRYHREIRYQIQQGKISITQISYLS